MIDMSRSSGEDRGHQPRRTRWERRFPVWHIACSVALSACFYVKPIPDRDANQPPQVVFPVDVSGPVPTTVLSELEHRVYVLAFDPDGDILTFVWSVDGAGELTVTSKQELGGDWSSTVSIPVELLQDGKSFEVTISDQAAPRNSVTVQWIVQVGL